jgi:hypothetical protein
MWGDKNDFPSYLIDVYKFKSITHKAIIDRKVDMMSVGFEETLDPVVQAFIKNTSGLFSEDTLEDILPKISLDLLIMGGFALEVIWSRDGKSIGQVEHIPFENVRIDKRNGLAKNGPNYYWISENWRNRAKYTPIRIQGFSEKHKEEKTQILYVTKYDAGKTSMSYPLVKWYSSINYILSEWDISQFHQKNIQNGFSAGYMINFLTGDVTDEEKAEAYRLFKDKFAGSYNTGQIILNWAFGSDQRATIEPIPGNDADNKFIELNNLIKANIMTANGVTNAELFSYDTSGGVKFTSKDQLREMLEVFQAMCIDPEIKIIERALNKLLKVNNPNGELKIKKYTI